MENADDPEIWDLAFAEDRIVVSKDVDFLLLSNRPGDAGRLLWVRVGNCRTPLLLARFNAAWPVIQAAFVAGQRVVELQ